MTNLWSRQCKRATSRGTMSWPIYGRRGGEGEEGKWRETLANEYEPTGMESELLLRHCCIAGEFGGEFCLVIGNGGTKFKSSKITSANSLISYTYRMCRTNHKGVYTGIFKREIVHTRHFQPLSRQVCCKKKTSSSTNSLGGIVRRSQ